MGRQATTFAHTGIVLPEWLPHVPELFTGLSPR
jgi:hypothetical protein